MLIDELIITAYKGIFGNKMRSFLTMLGIIIGVGSVITMLSLGEGAKRKVSDSIKSLGTNLLFVRPGMRRRARRSMRTQTLKRTDADAIKKYIPEVEEVSPEGSKNYQVKFFNKNTYFKNWTSSDLNMMSISLYIISKKYNL